MKETFEKKEEESEVWEQMPSEKKIKILDKMIALRKHYIEFPAEPTHLAKDRREKEEMEKGHKEKILKWQKEIDEFEEQKKKLLESK